MLAPPEEIQEAWMTMPPPKVRALGTDSLVAYDCGGPPGTVEARPWAKLSYYPCKQVA